MSYNSFTHKERRSSAINTLRLTGNEVPMLTPESKRCSSCDKIKPIDGFGINKNSKDGHSAACKPCLRFRNKKRRAGYRKTEKESRKTTRAYKSLQHAMYRNTSFGLPNECWEWQGYLDKKGYGKFNMKKQGYFAHRASYLLHYGILPADMGVCHHCDNPRCVNPYHLFLGTPADNMADCIRKHRNSPPPNPVGSKHPQSKLTEDNVRVIRKLRISGLTYREIGDRYGVTLQTIHNVCNGGWKHVT